MILVVDTSAGACFHHIDPFMTHFVTTNANKTSVNQTYIKVHVPLILKQQLQQLAQRRGVSVSSLLRLIAIEYINHKG